MSISHVREVETYIVPESGTSYIFAVTSLMMSSFRKSA